MKSYYAMKAVIRYYGAPLKQKWPDAPHVAFANLRLDEASLRMFTKRYGPLHDPEPDLDVAIDMQRALRSAWEHDETAILGLERTVMQHGLRPWFGITKTLRDLMDDPTPSDALTLWAKDMGMLVRMAFLMDLKQHRTKVCWSPDCPTPYFVQRRKGQGYCSQKCAVLVAVHNFRKRQRTKKGKK
jgi:hypothetical protein